MAVLAVRALLALVVLALLGAAFVVTQPFVRARGAAPAREADSARLRRHVEALAVTFAPRDVGHPENLDAAAGYIERELKATGAAVSEQRYVADRLPVRNLIASYGPDSPERIVVGAHYDACGPLPGADDNASGVAGLLELARLLAKEPPKMRVELVAFTLEEPPYFRSQAMGSAVHAASLKKAGVRVRAMLGLEMIGCFSDAAGSQSYPVPGMALLYPTRGNFVAIAGRLEDIALTRRVKGAMRSVDGLSVRSINAPARFAGIDLSDHACYWEEGFPAVMIGDTAFHRNERYHTAEDTADRLDYTTMAKVVEGLRQAVMALATS